MPRRRSCFNTGGSRKRAYLDRKAAKAAARKGQGFYQCKDPLHRGQEAWHVYTNKHGSVRPDSRRARTAARAALEVITMKRASEVTIFFVGLMPEPGTPMPAPDGVAAIVVGDLTPKQCAAIGDVVNKGRRDYFFWEARHAVATFEAPDGDSAGPSHIDIENLSDRAFCASTDGAP